MLQNKLIVINYSYTRPYRVILFVLIYDYWFVRLTQNHEKQGPGDDS